MTDFPASPIAFNRLLSDPYIWHAQARLASLVPSSSKVYDPVPSTSLLPGPPESWSRLVKAAEALEHRFGWTIHGEPVSRIPSHAKRDTPSVPALADTPVSTDRLPLGDETLALVPEHEAVLVWRKDRLHRRAVLLDKNSHKPLWSYSPSRWIEPSPGVHTPIGAIARDDWLIIGWDCTFTRA